MITAKQVVPGQILVTFTAPGFLDGAETDVVGDFNDWQPGRTRFEQGIATVTMAPGRYRFRYLSTDGSWFNDEQADDYEDNEFHGQDGVVDLTSWAEPDNDVETAAAQSHQSRAEAAVPNREQAEPDAGGSGSGQEPDPVTARAKTRSSVRARKAGSTRPS